MALPHTPEDRQRHGTAKQRGTAKRHGTAKAPSTESNTHLNTGRGVAMPGEATEGVWGGAAPP
eukprot:484006-Pelagomonas_calceolata.AAC.1